jgi:hypothetical protein
LTSFGVGGPVPLITIGLGPEPRLITTGLTPLIIKTIKAIRGGRAVYKKLLSEYEEKFKITAMIISNNGKEILNPAINKLSRIFLENNINIKKTFAKELSWKKAKRPEIEIKNLEIEHKKINNIKIDALYTKNEVKKNIKIHAKRK